AHAPLLLATAVEGDDDVVLLAAAQRVVHEVAVRADPDAGGVPLQVGGERLAVDDRAGDDMARDARLVADILPADRGLHAIGADQRAAAVAAALAVVDGDAAFVLLDALHGRARAHAHPTAALRALEERAVHVGAVDHRVRIAKAPAEGLVGTD